MQEGVAVRLAPLLVKIMLGAEQAAGDVHAAAARLPIRVRAWDGSAIGPATAPTFVIRHRRALRRLLWKPGEMGLVRAYVAGELDIEGDIFAALGAVQQVMRRGDEPIRLSSDDKREIVRTAVMLGAVGPEPKPPAEEFPTGRHAGEVTGPFGESADFFRLLLGESMAYCCGDWDGAADLEDAQRAMRESVVERLGLFPGARVLDLNCGWGSFAFHAAAKESVRVVGLTRSRAQADHVRRRAEEEGLVDRVEPRVGDLAVAGEGPYDVIVGLGGAELGGGIGLAALPAARLQRLLAPGGRLLVQQTLRRPGRHHARRTFTTSYMFPEDGELHPLGEVVSALEEAGLEVRTVTALREHYARTLRSWADNLRRHWSECGRLATPGRARVWLLYLAASALACESGRIGMHEIYAVRRDHGGAAHPAPTP
ncbi:class I SAM-dependent methyltransferase [Thermomonospora curvata]|uniref:Cyclopropane-fatty-acyl-phospholipid synthase n=1 Tax=Thermomonospora curvata (strain ATCC 19995 / DSM 43183 / JCM 3096 / KCTC 9072 / NBRC 15933 / NCIMB 10081 / Henssen B9) TaxID=471852 RepID=D1A7N9_THECD|nr:class I SAM-dependent methyltransferase [Thermomonospora curvata]ACY96628.1 Cyclopropane-fatty-acyl-phospholipid synthase [Thermomonospora curvata DSM 43183]